MANPLLSFTLILSMWMTLIASQTTTLQSKGCAIAPSYGPSIDESTNCVAGFPQSRSLEGLLASSYMIGDTNSCFLAICDKCTGCAGVEYNTGTGMCSACYQDEIPVAFTRAESSLQQKEKVAQPTQTVVQASVTKLFGCVIKRVTILLQMPHAQSTISIAANISSFLNRPSFYPSSTKIQKASFSMSPLPTHEPTLHMSLVLTHSTTTDPSETLDYAKTETPIISHMITEHGGALLLMPTVLDHQATSHGVLQ